MQYEDIMIVQPLIFDLQNEWQIQCVNPHTQSGVSNSKMSMVTTSALPVMLGFTYYLMNSFSCLVNDKWTKKI